MCIVERLRDMSREFPVGTYTSFTWKTDLCGEAADEIRRLREALKSIVLMDEEWSSDCARRALKEE